MNDFERWQLSRSQVPTSTESSAVALRAALGDTIREAWWRRGGELLEHRIAALPGGPLAAWLPQPTNARDVREALIAGTLSSSARWEFAPCPTVPERRPALVALLQVLETSDHPVAPAAAELVRVALDDVTMPAHITAGTISNDAVHDWAERRWGSPSAETTAEATRVLHSSVPAEIPAALVDADVLAAILADVVSVVAPTWSVVIGGSSADAMCRAADRVIVVGDHAQVTIDGVRRLVAHEIGGHVLRSSNAASTPGLLAQLPLGVGATATEEGLALVIEERLGVASSRQRRQYAARAVGVSLAREYGIGEVFDALTPWVGATAAATIAVRVKRGVPDLHAAGAFAKDHIYFSGEGHVRRILEATPTLLPALMSTKWSADLTAQHAGLLSASGDAPVVPDATLLALCDRAITQVTQFTGPRHA